MRSTGCLDGGGVEVVTWPPALALHLRPRHGRQVFRSTARRVGITITDLQSRSGHERKALYVSTSEVPHTYGLWRSFVHRVPLTKGLAQWNALQSGYQNW